MGRKRRVPSEQSSHHRSNGNSAGEEEKVGLVWQKCPSIAGSFRLREKPPQGLEKILPVLGISS
jgi:hypothetical protein